MAAISKRGRTIQRKNGNDKFHTNRYEKTLQHTENQEASPKVDQHYIYSART